MPEHLILALDAHMSGFGGEAIDAYGVVRDFPARSMLCGLIGNALGLERGGADADTLRGGEGSDILSGGAGDDMVYGDAGDDRFIGSLGADTLDGGDGIDTVDYSTLADITSIQAVLSGSSTTTITVMGIMAIVTAQAWLGPVLAMSGRSPSPSSSSGCSSTGPPGRR